jgi:hypothetical protein
MKMEGNMERSLKIYKEMGYEHQLKIVIGDVHLTIHKCDDAQNLITGRAINGS